MCKKPLQQAQKHVVLEKHFFLALELEANQVLKDCYIICKLKLEEI